MTHVGRDGNTTDGMNKIRSQVSKLNVILILREPIPEGRSKLALSSRSLDKSQHRP